MPPRTRNGGRARLVELGLPINTTGLPSLPVEILHEIVSHLVGAPVPCADFHVLSRTHLERPQTLRPLSETCQRLRSVFLARALEHLEVCASHKVSETYVYRNHLYRHRSMLWSTHISMEFARELVRQAEIVTVRNPALAQEVKIVTAVLSDWSAPTVLPEFFKCLSVLNNLHTIQIIRTPHNHGSYSHKRLGDLIGRVIEGHTFYAVHTLVLDRLAFSIVAACPNLERLTVNTLFSEFELSKIHNNTPKLRGLACLPIFPNFVQDLVKYLPNLAEIPPIRSHHLTPDTVKLLGSMKNLCKIDLYAEHEVLATSGPSPLTASLIAAAMQILRGSSPDPGGKYVTVTFRREHDWGTTLRRYPCQ
ncbi:hypothetical protein C8R44DRAFT_672034 [Mycena epipterygia]|nr:hypothetical protein C8R44DRAFT_672034 [Mycena epipterygia]